MSEWGDLKPRAKKGFYDNYLTLVVMGLIFTVISLIGRGSSVSDTLLKLRFSMPTGVKQFLKWLNGGGSFVLLLFNIFIGSAAELAWANVGLKAYRGETPEYDDLLLAFRGGRYFNVVGAYALSMLIIAAGLILLVVPGVIAACGLSRVPYLLAEDPSLGPIDAIRISWRLMKGRKGDYFLFVLSFIGWILLGVITFGIVMVLYTGPYMCTALAGYHDRVCEEYDLLHGE